MKTVYDLVVLFVDDEPEALNALRRLLRKEPYRTLFAGSGREALEILSAQPVDIIVSDLLMPEIDGLTLLNEIKRTYPNIIRLVFSATRDMGAVDRAGAGMPPPAHRSLAGNHPGPGELFQQP